MPKQTVNFKFHLFMHFDLFSSAEFPCLPRTETRLDLCDCRQGFVVWPQLKEIGHVFIIYEVHISSSFLLETGKLRT